MLMVIADGGDGEDVVHRHAALLVVTVDERALPYEMLLSVRHQDVIDAVERADDCLAGATLKLAGFVWSFES